MLLTRNRHLDAIRRAAGAPLRVWWQGPRSRVLVANRPLPAASAAASAPALAPHGGA